MKSMFIKYKWWFIGLSIMLVILIVVLIVVKRNAKKESERESGTLNDNVMPEVVGGTQEPNIVIGDSQTPYIAKPSQKVKMLGEKGSEKVLWLGGMGLSWLKTAVSKFPISPKVKNVVINIGTNGGFNTREDISGLISELRSVFPNAKLLAVQGSWGWGGNAKKTITDVKAYYKKFADLGVTIIEPPIGSVQNPHGHLPIYKEIAKSIDKAID